MPASPRRRACCNRHEARGGIVALVSCCLVRLSNGGLGPPDETAVVPLWRAASTRRLSEVPSAALATHCSLFFAVLNGTSRTCQVFLATQSL